MEMPEKQFRDASSQHHNSKDCFTLFSFQFKRFIAILISLVTILLVLYPISVYAELFSHENSEDRNGFNPNTNSSFNYNGIYFELPDYYVQTPNDDSSSVIFSNKIVKPTSRICFFPFAPHDSLGLDFGMDYFTREFFRSVTGNDVQYSSHNIKINGIDIYLLFPEDEILEGYNSIFAFLIPENDSQPINIVFIYNRYCPENYSLDFFRILWTASLSKSPDNTLIPYPAENFLYLPLQNTTRLPSTPYHSPEKDSTISGMIFYVDGIVTSVGTWEDTCKSIKATSDIENKGGTFVTMQNDLGYAVFSKPTDSAITLPSEGSIVRFYGQYVGYNEDIGAAILDINPDFDIMPEENKQPKLEITFRDIPWGTNYPDATSAIAEIAFAPFHGEIFKTYSVDQIITGKGITFEYTDINISASSIASSISVAGYETSNVELFFAYTPKNGILTKKEEDTALYGAMYEFEPVNPESMGKDLLQKLSSVYGEPDSTSYDSNIFGGITKYTYWSGANNTLLVLCVQDESNSSWKSSEKVRIIYAWRDGDELLQQASDCLKEEAIRSEESKYGNGNVNGL